MTTFHRKFEGCFENLAEIGRFIEESAAQSGLDETQCYAIQLAVDEAASNIIEHAYGGKEGGLIELTFRHSPDKLEIIVHDEGEAFDPENVTEYNVDLPIEDMQERGAGIHLIKNLMDEVDFEFDTKGGNTLTMVKILSR